MPSLLAGIASHHAGCLPAWKTLVEHLFQQGGILVALAASAWTPSHDLHGAPDWDILMSRGGSSSSMFDGVKSSLHALF